MNFIFHRIVTLFLSMFFLVFLSNQNQTAYAIDVVSTINCGADPLEPSRNILEITGNHPSTFFSVTAPSSNCNIYIHDVVFIGISFSANITQNSNITIINAVSTAKTRPAFVYFAELIADFGFININNVTHSSLTISPTSSSWISAMQFINNVTGKPDLTSWINISNVVMTDIVCDITSVWQCQLAMVKFSKSITNLASLRLERFTARNIFMRSTGQGPSLLFCHSLQGALEAVQEIELSFAEVSDVHIENLANATIATKLTFFGDSVSAGDAFSSSQARFSVRGYSLNNVTAISNSGSAAFYSVVVLGASVSNYSSISFVNMTTKRAVATASGAASAWMISLPDLIGPPSTPSSSSTSIIFNNLRFEGISLRSYTSSMLYLFRATGKIADYLVLSFISLSMVDASSISSPGFSNVLMVNSADPIVAPLLSASSSSSSLSSSITVDNFQMERINSQSSIHSNIFMFFVVGNLEGFDSLTFTNMLLREVNSTSSDDTSTLNMVYSGSSIIAPATTTTTATHKTSSMIVRNIRVEKFISQSSTYSKTYFIFVKGSIINFTSVWVSDVICTDMNSTSTNGYSAAFLFSCGDSITAPPSSSSSSFQLTNVHMARVNSQSEVISQLVSIVVGRSITDYNHVSITNLTVREVTSVSQSKESNVFIFTGTSIVAPAASSPSSSSSSLVVDNFQMSDLKLQGAVNSDLVLMRIGAFVSGFAVVSFTHLSLVDAHSTATTGFCHMYIFYCGGSLAAAAASSSSSSSTIFKVNNFFTENVSAVTQGATDSQIGFFSVAWTITNFAIVSFSNMSLASVRSSAPAGSSQVFMVSSLGISSPSSLASKSSMSFTRMLLRNLTALSSTQMGARIGLFNMDSPALIRGFDSVTFSDSLMQNVSIASASASSYILAFSPGGFQECNTIRVSNNIFQDVVIASTISSVASVALVSATSSSASCQLVEVNNNSISNISVVAPTQNAEINLMKLPFEKMNNISLHNNNIILNSIPPSTTTSSPNILVSMFPLSISSSTARFSLDISNCSLEIRSQYWQQLCNPANCSLIRVNDVQRNNNNNNNNNISISENSVTSPASSFLSFANFGNGVPNRADAILNFVVENNYLLNLSSSSSPILGFDMPSRLPPLIFVDVKCNHWLHETDRMSANQIILASSVVQANQFVQWSCPFHSPSRSLSITSTSSFGTKAASTSNQILAVVSNVAQSVGIVAGATVAAVSPSLGFGVARQQAMVNFMQNMRDGDCSGISDPNEVPAADSPTQMKIGISDAKFYIGGAVGNTILSIALILAMQIGGTVALKFSGSSSWNRPFDVFARCNVALVGYVCASLLLAPTLTFGLVTVSVSNIESLSVGLKILAIIFSVVFVVPTFYYAIWSVFLRPNMKLEQYRKLPKKNAKVSFIIRTTNFLFEGDGEWMLHKKANLNEKLNFDAATPMFEGYNGRAKWFGLVEFVVQVGLALAPFLANLVPIEKSCVTTFSVLIVVLGGYLLLSILLRPFQERFNRIMIPVVTLCQIGVVILTYAYADNPPDFIVSLAMATVSLQNGVIVIVLFASFSPLMKHALRAYRKFKKWCSNRKSSKNNRSHVPSLRYLMGDEQEVNLRNKEQSKNDGKSTKNKQHEQTTTRESRHKSQFTAKIEQSSRPQSQDKRPPSNAKYSASSNGRRIETKSSAPPHLSCHLSHLRREESSRSSRDVNDSRRYNRDEDTRERDRTSSHRKVEYREKQQARR